jgi:hypothetical protein
VSAAQSAGTQRELGEEQAQRLPTVQSRSSRHSWYSQRAKRMRFAQIPPGALVHSASSEQSWIW